MVGPMGYVNSAVNYVIDGPMGHVNVVGDYMMDGPMGHANTAVDTMFVRSGQIHNTVYV